MMLSAITRLDGLLTKHSRTISTITLWGNAIGGLISLIFGWHIAMVIFLVGFHYELNQIELAKLRREIRAKRRWDEGQA